MPFFGITGRYEAGWEIHGTRSQEEHRGALRRRPASAGSLHDQYQGSDSTSTTPETRPSLAPSSHQSEPQRPQLAILNTGADLPSPNSEVLQRIGRAPQPGIPQQGPLEALANPHLPVELSAQTETAHSRHQQEHQVPERPI
jgi:hypothetical protein